MNKKTTNLYYDEKSVDAINEKFEEVHRIHYRLLLSLYALEPKLKHAKAKEYLMHGVSRRLKILTKCIDNIFEIFPIDRTEHLSHDGLANLDINLHAFFINISGIFDNMAWVIAHERKLIGDRKDGKIRKENVSLFNKKFQKHLAEEYRGFLNSDDIKKWYSNYSKHYRDALAHRIPLYTPPSILTNKEAQEYQDIELQKQVLIAKFTIPENIDKHDQLNKKQSELGRPSPFFIHSIEEGSKQIMMHAQIITDYVTIEEAIMKFFDYFGHDISEIPFLNYI